MTDYMPTFNSYPYKILLRMKKGKASFQQFGFRRDTISNAKRKLVEAKLIVFVGDFRNPQTNRMNRYYAATDKGIKILQESQRRHERIQNTFYQRLIDEQESRIETARREIESIERIRNVSIRGN